jgi:hypothetical protein
MFYVNDLLMFHLFANFSLVKNIEMIIQHFSICQVGSGVGHALATSTVVNSQLRAMIGNNILEFLNKHS